MDDKSLERRQFEESQELMRVVSNSPSDIKFFAIHLLALLTDFTKYGSPVTVTRTESGIRLCVHASDGTYHINMSFPPDTPPVSHTMISHSVDTEMPEKIFSRLLTREGKKFLESLKISNEGL